MAWTYNNVRIFVQSFEESGEQTIVRLQPVEDGTRYQVFGYQHPTVNVGGIIVGDTDRESLYNFTKSGVGYDLYEDTTLRGNYLPHSIKFNRLNVVQQTLRSDLACDAPVYVFDLELYKVVT